MAAILAFHAVATLPPSKKGLIRIVFSVILCPPDARAMPGRASFRFPLAASTQPVVGQPQVGRP